MTPHRTPSPARFARPGIRWLVLACGSAALVAALGSAALAAAPSTLSYQGVLTDDAGSLVPDGPYDLTFRMYSVSSGGGVLWSETQSGLTVSKGGFAAVLGAVTPLGQFFNQQLYLGVAINGGAELVPRVPLTPAPHALSLRLPYIGSSTTTQPTLFLANTGGGAALAIDPGLLVGGAQAGYVALGGPAQPFTTATLRASTSGGALNLWSAVTGASAAELFVNSTYDAGQLELRGPNSATSLSLFGHVGGPSTREPYISMNGSSRSISFVTSSPGDLSVNLPASAISATETLDEPGIAQGHHAGIVFITAGPTVTELVSATITTPTSGYIVVEADGMHGIGGNGTAPNEADFSIKDTPGGGIDFGNYFVSGFAIAAPSDLFRTSVSMRRTHFKPAGTHTFYFQAAANNPSGFNNYIWNPTITATFFPTSYGTVTTIASSAEAAREGVDARAIRAAAGPGGERLAADAVEVDLRTLELRAAKLREAAIAAELAALEARIARQPEAKRIAKPPREQQP